MRHRRTRRGDLVAGTDLIEERFLYADDEIPDLLRMWTVLIETGTAYSSIVEDDRSGTPLAFGISAFIDDAAAQTFQAYAQPGLGRLIFERWRAGDSILLAESDIAAANAQGGLNTVVLATGWKRIDPATRQDAAMKLIEAFLDIHLGINMRSFTHELFGEPPFSPGALGLSLSPPHTVRDRSAQLLMLGSGEAIDNFVVAQMTRGVAPPRFFLSNRARAVLRFAIDGLLDAEIAHEVGISSNGLKKRWQQIFEQIRATDPDFFGNESSVGSDDGKRGAERRHSVLAYVRSHREELHPYATAPVGVS